MNDDMIFLVVIGFFVFDSLIIITVLWFFFKMMGRMVTSSAFPRLYDLWPALAKPPGKTFSRQYIALNEVWYKNAANLVIADEGLYVSFGFPVSLSISQAVLIPWEYLRYQDKRRAFWTDTYVYQILLDSPVLLTVMKGVARSFPKHL